MAEAKVSNVIIVLVLLGIVAVVFLGFSGVIAIGFLNKDTWFNLIAGAKGYQAAKTPTEAMEKFRDAIHKREYKIAGEKYCTKAYADLLAKAHDNAADLGKDIDLIREYKERALLTDKLRYLMHYLDPYPKNFKLGPSPKQDAKDDKKAVGSYVWEPLEYKDAKFFVKEEELKQIDVKMFQNVLVGYKTEPGTMAVNLVKEGEDWKLDVPVNAQWEASVNHFMDRVKTYHATLSVFTRDMNNDRYDTPQAFGGEVFVKLVACNK